MAVTSEIAWKSAIECGLHGEKMIASQKRTSANHSDMFMRQYSSLCAKPINCDHRMIEIMSRQTIVGTELRKCVANTLAGIK
jgi:hypothetical protein